MTDITTLERLYRKAQRGISPTPHMSAYNAAWACYYALLWGRAGGAKAALEWLKEVLYE